MSEHEEETTFEAPDDVPDSPVVDPETGVIEDDDTDLEPDGDGPDDDDDDDETVADYAPGVAEAALLSEREAKKRDDALDKENFRHAKRVGDIMGDEAQTLIPCPVCAEEFLGFVRNPEEVPLTPEMHERMSQLLGLADWSAMPTADWAIQCPTCQGFGKIKTGSVVNGREVVDCEDCGSAGWINTRKRGELVALPAEVVTGPTGPNVAASQEPDERVNQLRALGFTVIPPLQTSVPQA